MKSSFVLLMFSLLSVVSLHSNAQSKKHGTPVKTATGKNLYIDVHQLDPGKVKYEDVAKAHLKDLSVEKKYGVDFLKFWVDESKGLVYCLSSASDSQSIRKTHAEAHGLLPEYIYKVNDGINAATLNNQQNFFLDVHYLGAGNVTAKNVAEAHKKDLAVQQKYGVDFINYWVDEKTGVVMCLSQANDSASIIQTHKEAHGLVPAYVSEVKQGE
jgi:hypothetical protein